MDAAEKFANLDNASPKKYFIYGLNGIGSITAASSHSSLITDIISGFTQLYFTLAIPNVLKTCTSPWKYTLLWIRAHRIVCILSLRMPVIIMRGIVRFQNSFTRWLKIMSGCCQWKREDIWDRSHDMRQMVTETQRFMQCPSQPSILLQFNTFTL